MIITRTLHPSGLPTESDCQRRWATTGVPDLITAAGFQLRELPNSVGAAVGSGVHAGNAFCLDERRRTGNLGSRVESEERAIAEFDRRVAEEGCMWDEVTERRDTAQKQIFRMAASYRLAVAPYVIPTLVEERLVAKVAPGWEISGQVDTLTASPGALRDTKTGKIQRQNLTQYGTYLAILRGHGYSPSLMIEDYIPRLSLKRTQPPPIQTEFDPIVAMAEAREAVNRVIAAVAEFERRLLAQDAPPEMAFRPNPASPLCSQKWCRAWGTSFCKVHKK